VPQPIFRFAPSPNGPLHLGHACSALLNADLARERGGRLLLRMEDIDLARCSRAFEAAIIEDLAWLGLRWEAPVRRQSEHFSDYAAALEGLRRRGLVYPCFCSRALVLAAARALARNGVEPARDPDGAPLYPGACRKLGPEEAATRAAAGAPHVWRLAMDRALAEAGAALSWLEKGEGERVDTTPARPQDWGDAVLARRDTPTSYHLSVVVDDALQGVTDVVRGRDLFHATSLHRLLQTLLGLPEPVYRHHVLVLDGEGRKLSKSAGSPALRDLRSAGVSVSDLRVCLALDPAGRGRSPP